MQDYKNLLQSREYGIEKEQTCEDLKEKTYFDSEIVIPSSKEIFVDCGFCDGFSTRQFIKWCNYDYEKIVAFEPDIFNYNEALKIKDIPCLELHNIGCWREKRLLAFKGGLGEASCIDQRGNDFINADTIDNVLQGERCSFIKMDIEGAELDALYGAQNTIKKYRPKLAVSIYHKPEDIIKIPLYILELNEDYKLYLRHYTFGRWDSVLYAV